MALPGASRAHDAEIVGEKGLGSSTAPRRPAGEVAFRVALPPAPLEPDGIAGPPPPPEPRRRRPIAALGDRIRAGLGWAGRLTGRGARFVLLYALLAAISVAGGLAVVAIAAEYGYQPNRDTAAWAGLTPHFSEREACAGCHEPQAVAIEASDHGAVNCETCHGPLDDHVLAPTAEAVTLPGAVSGEPICLTCHEAVIGRPEAFPVVSSVTHFPLPRCTVCHDPHEPAAIPPPDIRHSLDRLPECTVCHQPDGIRPLPAGHPTWDGDCRACHRSAQALGS